MYIVGEDLIGIGNHKGAPYMAWGPVLKVTCDWGEYVSKPSSKPCPSPVVKLDPANPREGINPLFSCSHHPQVVPIYLIMLPYLYGSVLTLGVVSVPGLGRASLSLS